MEDLESENIALRNNAIYYLGENEEKRAVPLLVEFLNDDQPKETKMKAIEALGKIGEGSSVEALVGVLTETDKEMRIAAIQALGKIRDSKAVNPLIDILNNRNDKDITFTAIWALGNIGDKGAIPALAKLLEDQDKYVRHNASQSLKKIGGRF